MQLFREHFEQKKTLCNFSNTENRPL